MQTILNTPDDPAHDSLVEKKSEFIGDAAHVDTLDEALAFVAAIREQHPKARHVAYAAVCGGADGRLSERMSDDGEPSGTAGKPILDVLKQSGTTDCVVAVTRYFAGLRWAGPRVLIRRIIGDESRPRRPHHDRQAIPGSPRIPAVGPIPADPGAAWWQSGG